MFHLKAVVNMHEQKYVGISRNHKTIDFIVFVNWDILSIIKALKVEGKFILQTYLLLYLQVDLSMA